MFHYHEWFLEPPCPRPPLICEECKQEDQTEKTDYTEFYCSRCEVFTNLKNNNSLGDYEPC